MMRVGSGLDVHAFEDGRALILAGVSIAHPAGLAGHSDGDVVVHAAIDALLGAAGAGDIGARFGVDDPALADIDSREMLRTVSSEARATGWEVVNLDLTVVAQVPRLDAYRDDMRVNLASDLGVHPDQVSVKFTTTDHLGSIGRAEGIACWASCLVTADRD